MLEPFIFIWKHRKLIFRTAWSETKKRYAGSFFGSLWVVLNPLLFLLAYSTIYVYVFKIRFKMLDTTDYILLMFCGLIPCLNFSEALGATSQSITASSGLVKNTMFPVELLPVRDFWSTQITQLVSISILTMALLYFGKFSKFFPLFLLIWFLQILFITGIAWIISSINVIIRDLQYFISIMVFILIILSPIAYTIDMIPDKLKFFLAFNPLFYFVVSYQEIMMFGRLPQLHILIIMTLFSLLTFLVGFTIFKKIKPAFPDYL